ncbi:MAG: hypothetical protein JRC60_02995 [Deltaproteobacteria bacterium]|nr:hypothetical protein [Deltaproteobacteria bacterium]
MNERLKDLIGVEDMQISEDRGPANGPVIAPGGKIVPMKAKADGRCLPSLAPSASRFRGITECADCPGACTGDYALQIEPLFGDADAFAQILTRYKDHVMGIVSRHVPYDQAEETAHDAFIRAYQSLPTFKQKSEFKYWLSSIAVRTCHDRGADLS